MKKILSIILTILVLFSIPFSAFAAETIDPEQEELFSLACTVFPEYAALIRGEDTASFHLPRSVESNEIIHTEKRNISDTHSIGIAILANGNVIVVNETVEPNVDETDNSYTTVGSDRMGYASYTASCTNASGIYYRNNVGYILHQNGSGYFTSYGTESTRNDIGLGAYNNSSQEIYRKLTFNNSQTSSYRVFYTFTLNIGNGDISYTLG